ncbi:endothelin-converting enzyme 1 [Basidiobolus meristosporus CBS 931.73]|uniref:Endothelin-converting enzyme 1 n=1 Tax=Basidiobolus meristosporus CBS 931.73 TaxID=1314790 RepID=A0A1Y1YLG8_9FUNG|nr:endothelin-converting enzyme 1 [Basidiobolus meristosporus CBS 931.73]|eukprot:ORX98838.1 endothelin-converting enzyme 1 [Basidiobolus meristosporus CBS 931.73]
MLRRYGLFLCSASIALGTTKASSVKPTDNFYLHANEEWLNKTTIPSDYTSWTSYSELSRQNMLTLKEILDGYLDKPAGDLLGDFYGSGIQPKALLDPLEPLRGQLKTIDSIGNKDDVVKALAALHREQHAIRSARPLFKLDVEADSKNSNVTLASINQSGLGLPGKKYYSDTKASIHKPYQKHIQNMFQIAGFLEPEKQANMVFEVEMHISKGWVPKEVMRDVQLTYNKISLEKLKATFPGFPWQHYCDGLGLREWKCFGGGDVLYDNPSILKLISDTLQKFSVEHWKSYLRWFLISSNSRHLGKQFSDENFQFFGKYLRGQQSPKPYWKLVISEISRYLPDLLGQLYVKRSFSPAAKIQIHELVDDLLLAITNRIKKLNWMSTNTKLLALEKINMLNVKVGYPDVWIDYKAEGLSFDRGVHFIRNLRKAATADFYRDLRRMNTSTDKRRWEMPAFAVNAYYSPNHNEIVFPAGILQPPFYSSPTDKAPFGDPAANFGGIGTIIGHEITHAFDDQGRKYGPEGNLEDWWTKRDAEMFTASAKDIVDQFNQYKLKGIRLNGNLTQGENIADLGGVKLSFVAFKEWLKRHPNVYSKETRGATPEQQFFYAYARIWRNLLRDKEASLRISTNVHSPGLWRVNGPLSNLPEFYSAFNVKPGDKMWRSEEDRVEIW